MSEIKGSEINLSCKTKRITWLDSCKGIAMFFVVFGHIADGYINAGTFPQYLILLTT